MAGITHGRTTNTLRLLALGVPLALLLAGCGASKLGEGEVSEGERRFTEKLLFPVQKLPEAKPFNQREFSCPTVELQDGTAAIKIGGQSARGVFYQASIHDMARECATEAGVMRVKVGVRGRVVVGEGGSGGTVGVPVRIVVKDGDRIVSTRLVSTSVSVPADGSVPFSLVDESVSVSVTDKDPGEQYVILVGLDPQGSRGAAPRKKRRR